MVDIYDRASNHQEALSKAISRGRTSTRLTITIKPMVIDKEDPEFVAKWETAIKRCEQKLANTIIEHLKNTATKINLAIRALGKNTFQTLKVIDPSRAKDVIERILEEAQVKRTEKQENRKKQKELQICTCINMYKFSRDVNFAVFTVNLSSMKFKSSKFHKTIVIHLKHKV